MKKRICALLLCVLLMLSLLPASAAESEGKRLYNAINDIVEYVEANYHFGVSDSTLLRLVMEDAAEKNGGKLELERALRVIFSSLDPYSMYYSDAEYRLFTEETGGSFSGIGVQFVTTPESLLIVDVFDPSPAKEAGIKQGDLILAVDGESVVGHTTGELLTMVRGETGSTVTLTVKRGQDTLLLPVVRAPIEEEEVFWEMLPEGVGYIRISSFNAATDRKLAAAMEGIARAGCKKMILDLRDNGGGMTASALRALDLVIPKDKTVLNVRFGDEEVTYISQNTARQNPYKLVLLVNENTASAAEIFTGALKDNEEATVIGTTTFGKGTMQEVRPLSVGGGIRLTIAEFFTPKGNGIRDEGIAPDITVKNDISYLDEASFQPLSLFDTAGVGTESDNVLAVEERLAAIGYLDSAPDRVFGEDTHLAIQEFQAVAGLSMSGEADTMTLISLNNVEYDEIAETNDLQLRAAIDHLCR